MRFCLPLAFLFLLLSSFAYSQSPALPKYANAAFFQLGGISPVYSFNYERLIRGTLCSLISIGLGCRFCLM